MSRLDYLEKEIGRNKYIYIDTSSIMNYVEFESFVENCENILLEHGKKIIIIGPVFAELTKHSHSYDRSKQDNAVKALALIQSHNNIFQIENGNPNEDKPLADSSFIGLLAKNKPFGPQLFISEDKKLDSDITNLNSLDSVKGSAIHVCKISRSGFLKSFNVFTDKKQEENTIKTAAIKKESENDNSHSIGYYILCGVLGVATGIALEETGCIKKVLYFVKTQLERI